MSRDAAKAQYDREPGEPPEEYITPENAKNVVDIIYDDMQAAGAGGRASRWFWGTGDPANADPQAVPGDDFLDLTTFDLYGYTAPVNLTPGGP